MAKTFTTCSWLLAAVGVAVTLAYFPYVAELLPLGFLPYALLLGATRSARRPGICAVVLGLMLGSVSASFWCFWDAILRPSTLNFLPMEVLILESLVAGVAWFVVHRLERSRPLLGTA